MLRSIPDSFRVAAEIAQGAHCYYDVFDEMTESGEIEAFAAALGAIGTGFYLVLWVLGALRSTGERDDDSYSEMSEAEVVTDAAAEDSGVETDARHSSRDSPGTSTCS